MARKLFIVVIAVAIGNFAIVDTALAAKKKVKRPRAGHARSLSAADASGRFASQAAPRPGSAGSGNSTRLTTRAAVTESSTTTVWPWSGYWWPTMISSSRNLFDSNEAMHYYDYYVYLTRGTNPGAQTWERNNHVSAESWNGHCHAWAAASTLVKEPPSAGVTRAGLLFPADVLEGLIVEMHYTPVVSVFKGTRNDGTSTTTAAYKDIRPQDMDYMLRTYLKAQKKPFIMDIEVGSQVWNFPAFAYSRTGSTIGNVETVSTMVWYRDALLATWGSTNQNTAGQYTYRTKTYTYTITTNATTGVKTGAWTGASVNDHPDFAWVAGGKSLGVTGNQRNPKLNETIVEEILGYQI